MRTKLALASALALAFIQPVHAADHKWGLKTGTPELKSAGALSFAADGIVIVGDPKGATVFAIDTGSAKGDASKVTHSIDGLNEKVAAALSAKAVTIKDLAVNPATGQIILSVTADDKPALVRIDEKGVVSALSLKDVPFSKVTLPDAPEDKDVTRGNRTSNPRNEAITDVAYINGRVLVAGLSNGQSPSTVRELAFPFEEGELGTPIEIYHAAHGKTETTAVVRAFIPLTIGGETNVLAGFTCTPLVRFPITGIEPGKKLKGTTVAELGNQNMPLDMIAYEKDGKTWLLMANSRRGVMKIDTDGITKNPGLTEPVRGGGVAGQTYTTIKELEGTVQLDKLNDKQAVVVIQKDGAASLKTVPLP